MNIANQALIDSQNEVARLEKRVERLREAIITLRDCDWVIRLPDRMDAVRDIARKALERDGE